MSYVDILYGLSVPDMSGYDLLPDGEQISQSDDVLDIEAPNGAPAWRPARPEEIGLTAGRHGVPLARRRQAADLRKSDDLRPQ